MSGVIQCFVRRVWQSESRFGVAWALLSFALAVHVADEALTDFLSFFNPTVRAIREQLPFLPLPTFTFGVWLTGLIVVVIVLLSLSPFAFRGARWVRFVAYPFSVLMIGNGLMHIAGSFYLGRRLPGVYSSPLLLGSAIYLLACVRQTRRKTFCEFN
jgi:hypothetical protein